MDLAVAAHPLARIIQIACLVVVPLVGTGGVRVDDQRAPSNAWVSASRLVEARSYARAVELARGKILVVGGLDPDAPDVMRRSAELVDETTGESVAIPGPSVARIGATLTVLRNGNVLLAGGAERVDNAWSDVASAEIFEPRTMRWRTTAPLRLPRAEHGAVLLADGRVLVAGGQLGIRFLDTAELFDPSSETWSSAARMPETRSAFSLALLLDGRVLLAGGLAASIPTRTSLFYDPRRNAWRPGPDTALERLLHASVTLANGDVLLAGGQLVAAGSAERFDVRSGTFTYAGTLVWPRMIALAGVRPDGRVVVAGGLPRPAAFLDHFAPMSTTEIYDPTTNHWSAGPKLPEGIAVAALVSTKRGIWLLGGAMENEVPVDTISVLR